MPAAVWRPSPTLRPRDLVLRKRVTVSLRQSVMARSPLRRVDMMVMLENRLDALVRLHTPLPPAKIGGAHDPLAGRNNLRMESFYGPNSGLFRGAEPGGLCDDRQ